MKFAALFAFFLVSPAWAEEVQCPEFSPPVCTSDQMLIVDRDANGCNTLVCTTQTKECAEGEYCPETQPPPPVPDLQPSRL